MPDSAMNHFTILAGDVAATTDFYSDLLGLAPGPRPPFDFPGARVELDFAADETR